MPHLATKLTRWFERHARLLPWRQTRDPYAIWISEIMLQQTQVATVIPYYRRWMLALPGLEAFARARPDRVLKLWEGLGYYSRARNAQAAARIIVNKHSGRFPETFEDVLALPGVGRYTAGAICSIAFNQPTAILDGNVKRVLSRLLGIAGDPRDAAVQARLWKAAEDMVRATADPSRLNQGMMELGALICLPRNPKCPECPWRGDCHARRENRVADFPAKTQRPTVTRRRFIALVALRRGRYLVRRRPAVGVNAGLWEFPNFEAPNGARDLARLAAPFVISGRPVFRVNHTITRHRILLEAFRARLSSAKPAGVAAGKWKTPAQLRRLAFAGAHRKLLEAANVFSGS